ncbi:MAG: hypothetical protein ACK5LF_09900 [Bacteroides xylanisolvens]
MRTYIFEYNESDGNFHQNFDGSRQRTNGYQTVCETYEFIWDPFSRMLHRRYEFCSEECPSFAIIKTEWENYLLLRKEIEDQKNVF